METIEIVLFVLALVFGLYMAWSIGANDVANAMGTSVGSGALTLKRAVILASILEFSGAFFVGSHVSETVRKGIIETDIFAGHPLFLVYGMLAALLSAAIWLQLASFFGWPVSTTHSIVGAIIGFGVVVGGMEAVHWEKVGAIVSSWVISPIMSGVIAFILFSIIRKRIFHSKFPVRQAKKATPVLVFFVFVVLTLVLVFKGLKNLHLDLSISQSLLLASLVGLIAAFVSHLFVRGIKEEYNGETAEATNNEVTLYGLKKVKKHLNRAMVASDPEVRMRLSSMLNEVQKLRTELDTAKDGEKENASFRKVERIFVYLQILSACFVAFAHGANDVANAIGPLAAVIAVLRSGVVVMKATVPLWVLALGGVGIIVGLATWGWRVIETVGKRITELTPSRGFSAEFAAAITIVLASKLGIPVSTTHTLIGAVLGVGIARGLGAINLGTVRDIVISWIVTIPAGAGLAIVLFYIFKAIFG